MVRRATEGNDQIIGSELRDTIDGLGGDDRIFGREDNDRLSGGPGSDSIRGYDGNDSIFAGNDQSDDLNRLFGDDGNDRITGSLGRDSIFGGTGNDDLFGRENDDFVNGQAGRDFLVGGKGNDFVNGGSGNDILQGNGQFDDGEGQIDVLSGNGDGVDNGESDRDEFRLGTFNRVFYDDGIANTRGDEDVAVITDFDDGKDVIRLSGRVDYRFENVDGRGAGEGVGIFVDNSGGTVDELIGIVENVEISQLSSSKKIPVCSRFNFKLNSIKEKY